MQLLKEAGYKGEPITVLAATDHNTITPATQVLIQAMREAGITERSALSALPAVHRLPQEHAGTCNG